MMSSRQRWASEDAPRHPSDHLTTPLSHPYAAAMKRVLITGMSGTGKSTVIAALAARGHKAIDADSDAWSEWVNTEGDGPEGRDAGRDWVWRADRLQRLLAADDAETLFVGGCASNQGRFYPQFDQIILLSAPAETIAERLATRTNNPYGKHPDELAQVLTYLETVEPLLRRGASLELDTRAPVAQVVAAILDYLRLQEAPCDG
jgi:shikimate kinase